MYDFPASPVVDQQYPANGSDWVWDGALWMRKRPAGIKSRLLKAGATTTNVQVPLHEFDARNIYHSYRLIINGITAAANMWMMLRYSYDNGATFPANSGNYASNYFFATWSTVPTRGNSGGDTNLTRGIYCATFTIGQNPHTQIIDIPAGSATQTGQMQCDNAQVSATMQCWGIYGAVGRPTHVGLFGQVPNGAGAVNFTATYQLWGF